MQYIIYSNGARGYGFYASSDNFQEKYKIDIEELYTQSNIVNPDPNCDLRSIRLSPLSDKYLISVIYRNCTGNNESRRMITGVNYLLDYDELERFIFSGPEIFMKMMQQSDEILKAEGYRFATNTYTYSEFKAEISENCKYALLAAAYSAMDYADKGNYRLQSFAGYKTLSEAFEMVRWMFNIVPIAFWKYLSVYIGATKASETMDVTLALIEENSLEYIDKQDEYSGTMPIPKVVQYGGYLSGKQYIPSEATKYMVLSNDDLTLVKKVFQYTDGISKFWEFVERLADDVKSENIIKTCVDVLGEELTIKCLEKNILSEEALVLEVSKNRNAFKACNKLMELADNKIKKNQKTEPSQKEKKSKKSTSKKKAQKTSAEKTVDQSKAQGNKSDTAGIFGFVSALVKNRFLLYIIIAILSLLVIVSVNAFAVEMSLKLFSEGLKLALLKTVPFGKYVLTLVGVNIVNIPVGFTFVASVIELFKMHSDNKRR